MAITISNMSAHHWPEVAAIYQAGIDTGHATFALAPPASWAEWCSGKINACSLVAHEHEVLLGWAALGPFSAREVYAGVAEVSLYIKAGERGRGVGLQLLEALIARSEARGIWTLQAGIFPENVASLKLHFKCGFREVGRRERLGKMAHGPLQGQWRDVLLLEKRSQIVGCDPDFTSTVAEPVFGAA